jgi:hypothetical protein
MGNLFVFDNPKDKQVWGGLLHSFWSSWSQSNLNRVDSNNS